MQPELKPCPFCGEPPVLTGGVCYSYCQISCENAECYITCTTLRSSETDAVEAWNHRAEPDPPVKREDA